MLTLVELMQTWHYPGQECPSATGSFFPEVKELPRHKATQVVTYSCG